MTNVVRHITSDENISWGYYVYNLLYYGARFYMSQKYIQFYILFQKYMISLCVE